MIAVIDYDAGNILSVVKALNKLSQEPVVTRDKEVIMQADKVILPGVGAFADAMDKLNQYELVPVIRDFIKTDKPFLGICLGLQLLFDESEEAKDVMGIGALRGKVRKIPVGEYTKIPHMGWNSLSFPKKGRLFEGIEEGSYVYFVHSYYLEAQNREIVSATSEYNVKIDASIEAGNVFACQFHPEKSGEVGLRILKNFVEL